LPDFAPFDRHRHVPVLPSRHLNALKIEEMLPPGLKVVHVKGADDLLPLDHIASIDRSLPRTWRSAGRRCRRALCAGSVNVDGEGGRRAGSGD
jgi:hypothetical protein